MRKYCIASLCKNGIIGGGLLIEDDAVTYCTNKLTVNPKYRRLRIPYTSITSYEKGTMLIFPTVTLHLDDGTDYKFIVFHRFKFTSVLDMKLA